MGFHKVYSGAQMEKSTYKVNFLPPWGPYDVIPGFNLEQIIPIILFVVLYYVFLSYFSRIIAV